MSRKEELLKLAKLFHSQASRTGTPAVKQTLHRMGQYYQNEAAHAPDRDLNDNEDPGSSIATPSRLHKPVELFREFVWAAATYETRRTIPKCPGKHP